MSYLKTNPHWVKQAKSPPKFLAKDDSRREVQTLKERGVPIISEPEKAPWGINAAFADLYGKTFVLV